jgi:hypothetical protein
MMRQAQSAHQRPDLVLETFAHMKSLGVVANDHTYASVIGALALPGYYANDNSFSDEKKTQQGISCQ